MIIMHPIILMLSIDFNRWLANGPSLAKFLSSLIHLELPVPDLVLTSELNIYEYSRLNISKITLYFLFIKFVIIMQ